MMMRSCCGRTFAIVSLLIGTLIAHEASGETEPGPAVLPPPASTQSAPALPAYPATDAPEISLPPTSAVEQVGLPPPLDSAPTVLVDGEGTSLPHVLAEGAEYVHDDGPSWYHPAYWFGPVPWDSGIELGLNGTSGTSDAISFRAGGYLKQSSEFSKIDLSAYYNRTNSGGTETQNNAQLDARNDWLFDESVPWTLFATGTLFYDEFQAFDLQVNASGGVGYRFIDEEWLSLLARIGSGASREIGGTTDRWIPEALFGFDYRQHVSPSQKVYAKVDYFPQWEQWAEYRLVADVGWEIELNQPSNMSLKISAIDRYDSTPNGADPHNLNYAVLLLWKL